MQLSISNPKSNITTPTDNPAAQALQKAQSVKSENAKIDKSASDFESLLLTNWLQGAQESFASVPGGDGEEDTDPGRGQLQQLSMQSLGTALTASGGIGLAHSIAHLLHRSGAAPPEPNPLPHFPLRTLRGAADRVISYSRSKPNEA